MAELQEQNEVPRQSATPQLSADEERRQRLKAGERDRPGSTLHSSRRICFKHRMHRSFVPALCLDATATAAAAAPPPPPRARMLNQPFTPLQPVKRTSPRC